MIVDLLNSSLIPSNKLHFTVCLSCSENLEYVPVLFLSFQKPCAILKNCTGVATFKWRYYHFFWFNNKVR